MKFPIFSHIVYSEETAFINGIAGVINESNLNFEALEAQLKMKSDSLGKTVYKQLYNEVNQIEPKTSPRVEALKQYHHKEKQEEDIP